MKKKKKRKLGHSLCKLTTIIIRYFKNTKREKDRLREREREREREIKFLTYKFK